MPRTGRAIAVIATETIAAVRATEARVPAVETARTSEDNASILRDLHRAERRFGAFVCGDRLSDVFPVNRPDRASRSPCVAARAARFRAASTLARSTFRFMADPTILPGRTQLLDYPKYTTHRRSAYKFLRDTEGFSRNGVELRLPVFHDHRPRRAAGRG